MDKPVFLDVIGDPREEESLRFNLIWLFPEKNKSSYTSTLFPPLPQEGR